MVKRVRDIMQLAVVILTRFTCGIEALVQSYSAGKSATYRHQYSIARNRVAVDGELKGRACLKCSTGGGAACDALDTRPGSA